ncbi:MAG: glycosyltransferase [Gloeomargaritaceae cyanobacterium C42_A2020_066]|nr:glycosyltransferase [Gloeomargaritaceae cyanobacterium C42_A2020_066]
MASNPRLVKEANALHTAGYQVRVVAGDYMAAIRPLDRTILEQAPWQWTQVKLPSGLGYTLQALRQRTLRQLTRPAGQPLPLDWTAWAFSRIWRSLARAAATEPADLYIGHNLPALPAVAWAARHHGTAFGFDAEDDHVGELEPTPKNALEIDLRRRLEHTLLPQAHHLTAASPGIADAYAQRYGLQMQSILNVFPRSEGPAELTFPNPNAPPSLYWFSQTIGPGRGLEAIVTAMGQMSTPVHLYLRGLPAQGYEAQLRGLAQRIGVGERVHVLEPAPPGEMVRLAAQYDLGLSLELTTPPNRAICLTNKIFAYLLAGRPVVLSRTPAQDALANDLGEAATSVDLNRPDEIAVTLDQAFSNPTCMAQRCSLAWTLGQQTYTWDVEKMRFLDSVEAALRQGSLRQRGRLA